MVRFGTFEFDAETGELRRTGTAGRAGVVRLEPQPARALAALVARPGEIVTRDQLKTAIWGDDTHVDFDRGLAYCMTQVRSALGDSADNPRFVETLPRRGYRFIAPVAGESAGELAARTSGPPYEGGARGEGGTRNDTRSRRWLLAAMVAAAVILTAAAFWWSRDRPVLAVAVFDNETGNPAWDAQTAALSDAIVIHLGTLDLSRIGIIGNTSEVRMPRETRDLDAIRAQTGASFVLLGQLQTTDTGHRLLTHIIRLEDGRHVWVKRYDRPASANPVAGLELDVLRDVEAGVRAHVLGDTPLSSPPAATR
jgi:DNA-binding winged helix-turn-helix (wHTH) protein/TolB-like protein